MISTLLLRTRGGCFYEGDAVKAEQGLTMGGLRQRVACVVKETILGIARSQSECRLRSTHSQQLIAPTIWGAITGAIAFIWTTQLWHLLTPATPSFDHVSTFTKAKLSKSSGELCPIIMERH